MPVLGTSSCGPSTATQSSDGIRKDDAEKYVIHASYVSTIDEESVPTHTFTSWSDVSSCNEIQSDTATCAGNIPYGFWKDIEAAARDLPSEKQANTSAGLTVKMSS